MAKYRWSLAIGSLLLFGHGPAASSPAVKMPLSVDVTGRRARSGAELETNDPRFSEASERVAMSLYRVLCAALIAILAAACAGHQAQQAAAVNDAPSVDVTGRWSGFVGRGGFTADMSFDLQQDGAKVSGRSTVSGFGDASGDLTGTVSGNVFTYTLPGNRCCGELIVKGDQMSGRGFSGYPVQLQRNK